MPFNPVVPILRYTPGPGVDILTAVMKSPSSNVSKGL